MYVASLSPFILHIRRLYPTNMQIFGSRWQTLNVHMHMKNIPNTHIQCNPTYIYINRYRLKKSSLAHAKTLDKQKEQRGQFNQDNYRFQFRTKSMLFNGDRGKMTQFGKWKKLSKSSLCYEKMSGLRVFFFSHLLKKIRLIENCLCGSRNERKNDNKSVDFSDGVLIDRWEEGNLQVA